MCLSHTQIPVFWSSSSAKCEVSITTLLIHISLDWAQLDVLKNNKMYEQEQAGDPQKRDVMKDLTRCRNKEQQLSRVQSWIQSNSSHQISTTLAPPSIFQQSIQSKKNTDEPITVSSAKSFSRWFTGWIRKAMLYR
jgi:hypothetical protein